jgi:hypothetical protein
MLTRYQNEKSRCLLNQISQRKIVEKLHPAKGYINMSQAIGKPICHIIYKTSKDESINFPTSLPPLVQWKIKEANDERHNKDDVVAHVTLFERDNKTLSISLYDDNVLYTMQHMGYDISTDPSLCDGQGELAPFEESLSQAQLDAFHIDTILKEEKYWLGYEVHMTSIESIDVTPASP